MAISPSEPQTSDLDSDHPDDSVSMSTVHDTFQPSVDTLPSLVWTCIAGGTCCEADIDDVEFMSNIAKFAALAIERVKRDNSLREMAAIVETTDDAIILKNLDAVIEKWNAGAQHIYGYTASEAIGQNVSMLVPEDR